MGPLFIVVVLDGIGTPGVCGVSDVVLGYDGLSFNVVPGRSDLVVI